MKRIILVIALTVLNGCSRGNDWTAFVYPDIKNIPYAGEVQNFTIGNYPSFEECQVAAVERVNHNLSTSGIQGDYECGYKCTNREELGGLLLCKEDRK